LEAAASARAEEVAKQAEAVRQAEVAARQEWEARAQLEEAARQAWEAGAPARAVEAAKEAEAANKAETAQRAEVAKRAEEAARQVQEAEAQPRDQEQGTRRQEEYKLKAYVEYTIVKRCHDEREWGYISEPQLAKAQAALNAIEQKIKNPNIDLDALWKQANTVADDNFSRAGSMSEARAGHPTNPVEMLCNEAFAQLMQFNWWIVPE
jgi:hypothetical protein